jgi:uncharacterized membrane protein YphA (DoxX/SURF4 family)
MNIVLWVLQVLLAVAFLAHGWLLLSPPPDIAAQMNASLPRWFQLFLGVAEVLAAVRLTLPGLTRIMPNVVTQATEIDRTINQEIVLARLCTAFCRTG